MMQPEKIPEEPPGKKLRGGSWTGRSLKRMAVLLVAALLCAAAAMALLQTDAVRSRLKAILLEQLGAYLNATVEIGRMEGDFFRELTLEKIRVSDTDGDILRCERLSLNWLIPLLLKKTVYIQSAEISGLRIQWRFYADGESNFTRMLNSDAPSDTASDPSETLVILKHLVLKDSGILFIEQADGTIGPDISVSSLVLQLEYGRLLRFDIAESAFTMNFPPLPQTGLKGVVVLDPETLRFQFDKLDVITGDSSVQVTGEMSFEAEVPSFDLSLQSARLNLAALDREFDLNAGVTGISTGSASVKGDFSRFEHRLNLAVGDASFGSEGTIAFLDDGGMDLAVIGQVRQLNPGRAPFEERTAFDARMNADFRIQGKCGASHPVFDGSVDITMFESEMAGIRIAKGRLAAVLSNASITIKTLALDGNFGLLQANGETSGLMVENDKKTALLTLSWTVSDPTGIPILREAGLNGPFRLGIDLDANFPADYDWRKATGKITGRLTNSGLRAFGMAIKSGEVHADIDSDQLTIKDCRVITSAGELSFRGGGEGLFSSQPGKRMNVTADFLNIDPSVFPVDRNINGNLSFHVEASAQLPPDYDVKSGRMLFKTEIMPSVMGEVAIHSGTVEGEWDAGNLRVDRFELDTGQAGFSAEGRYDETSHTGQCRVQADIADLKQFFAGLNSLVPIIPEDMTATGRVQAVVTAAGPIAAPDFSLQLAGTGVGAMGLSADSLSLNVRWTGYRVIPEKLSAELTASHIDYDGNRFTELHALLSRHSGDLKADLKLSHQSGHVLEMNAAADDSENETKRIAIKTLSVYGPDLPESEKLINRGPILLRWNPQMLAVDTLHVGSKAAELTANGLISFHGEQRLDVHLSGLEIERFIRLWNPNEKISGLASADVYLGGSLSAPVIEGRVRIGNLTGYEVAPADLSADVSYRNGAGGLRLDLARSGETFVAVIGGMDMPIGLVPFKADFGASRLRLSVKAGARLSELPIPVVKEVSYDALADIDLILSGKTVSPDISGHIRLSDGRLAIPRKGLLYDTVSAEIDLENRRIDIREILLKGKKEGFLRVDGNIELDDLVPAVVDLRLTGENFLVPYQKAIQARLSPKLTLKGPMAAPALSGVITVVESKINLDKIAPQTPPEIIIVDGTAEENGTRKIMDEMPMPSFLKGLSADVIVTVPKNAWLKGQDINAEITGEVALKKTVEAPFTLIGDLRTIRGTYNFRGKLFKIEQGTVTFIGLDASNPLINLRATSRIYDATIIILLSGSADQLVLTLDSDPKMDQSDIVSYLVFGKPADSLKGGQAFNAESAALSLSGGMVANELRSILGDVFFLDLFAIESGDDSPAGSVSFGKYVRPNIFIVYRQGLSEDRQNQVEISYELSPNIRVETQLGNDRNNGVDLFWEFDF